MFVPFSGNRMSKSPPAAYITASANHLTNSQFAVRSSCVLYQLSQMAFFGHYFCVFSVSVVLTGHHSYVICKSLALAADLIRDTAF